MDGTIKRTKFEVEDLEKKSNSKLSLRKLRKPSFAKLKKPAAKLSSLKNLKSKINLTKFGKKDYIIALLLFFIISLSVTPFILSAIRKPSKESLFLQAVHRGEKKSTIEALKDQEVSSLNDIFELPEGNVILGKVNNVDDLKQFDKNFEKTKPGDLVLVYPEKTIIYDPQNKYIVDIISVNLLDQQIKPE